MISTVEFKIQGMDCAEEVATLQKELSPLPGVKELQFDLLNARMTVTFQSDQTTPTNLIAAVSRTGMKAELWLKTSPSLTPNIVWQARTLLTVISGLLLVTGFLIHTWEAGLLEALSESGAEPLALARLLYLAAIAAGMWLVLPKAWLSLSRLRPDMNLLMTVAVTGAVLIGQWFEAATVAFLFGLSITLEAWSVHRARRAIAALMAMTPPKARLVMDQAQHLVDVADVKVGAVVLVKPGEKFPLDGQISKGQTTANEAPITGESMPVAKAPGSEVFAGTINQNGTVEFITTTVASNTTMAQIVKMVGEAQAHRSQSEQWVERFARHYTPIVMVLALAVALIPPLLFDGLWMKWLYESLVLLVIACPCALVISTPVSVVAALAAAAKAGVLIKGGIYLETAAHLRAVAFDKTGTLTEGRAAVQEAAPLSGHSEKELLEIAAAVESQSGHPLARAIVAHAQALGICPQPAEHFQVLDGKGAKAILHGKPVWVGSHRYLEERGQDTSEIHDRLETLASSGASVVVVGNDEHVCGFIAVADRIRHNAKAAISALRSAGIEKVIVLTGDNQGTAASVGREVGADEVRAELLPTDKLNVIEQLVSQYRHVAMVGDGVNDAPAMARAPLGIAMGAAGSDAAIETADIALMSDNLSRIPWLVRHAQRTLSIIRQNITASLGVKVLFVALTFAGRASLWGAIAADMGVSLAVVFNALRLLDGRLSEGAKAYA